MTSSASALTSSTCPVSNEVTIGVPYQTLTDSASKAHHPPPDSVSSSAKILNIFPAQSQSNKDPDRKDPIPETRIPLRTFQYNQNINEQNHPMKCVSACFSSLGLLGVFSVCGGGISNRFFDGSNDGYWIGPIVALLLICCWYKVFVQSTDNNLPPRPNV